MDQQEHLDALSDIRNLMERTSRFLSLSGLSGIFIGFYALAGAGAAWWYLNHNFKTSGYYNLATAAGPESYWHLLTFLIADASLVMLLSLLTGYILTQRRARKQGLNIWDASAKRLLYNLFITLLTG